jgi:hypothetical protein
VAVQDEAKWRAHGRVLVSVVPGCDAKVAELVDALDLGSSGVTRESSSLSFRTSLWIGQQIFGTD